MVTFLQSTETERCHWNSPCRHHWQNSFDKLKVEIGLRLHKMTEASKGYVSLFDLGESKDDVEVDYNSLYMHHYKVLPCRLNTTFTSFLSSRLTRHRDRARRRRWGQGRCWMRSLIPRLEPHPSDHPGYMDSILSVTFRLEELSINN